MLSLMTLFGQQSRAKIRPIAVWVIVWSLLSCLFVAVFEDLHKTAEQSSRLFQSLPPAVLQTFNISTDYLTKSEKFLSGQFLTVYLLAGSIYALFLGVSAIGGKIEDATIANYLTKPFSRFGLYITSAMTNIFDLFISSTIVGIIMFTLFTAFSGQTDISKDYFVVAFLGSAVLFTTMTLLGQLLGVIIGKVHAQAAGAAIIVFSFFINGLGALAGVPSWLQKTSLFYYFDTIKLRDFYAFNFERLAFLVGLSIILLLIGGIIFRRKNIYI